MEHTIIGLMSGTSMDGLDIACVTITGENDRYRFHIDAAGTVPYPEPLASQLLTLTTASGYQLVQFDLEYGKFMATSVLDFLKKHKLPIENIRAIASHGHTVFHQPQNAITFQAGSGQSLAYFSGLPVICDFRTKDVLAGGQGAPLVPIGDQLLFKESAAAFLNIGGFCNISFSEGEKVRAFDICPGNLPLNKLARFKGLSYDKNGETARQGSINFFLLDLLNNLDFYAQEGHKSLGTEWLEEHFYPLVKFDRDIENNLRTITEHIAIQISEILNRHALESVMITGGGAHNSFLVERIAHYYDGEIRLPDRQLIDFKEAVIFAFLGFRYLEGKSNSLASVTGASKDLVNGAFYLP